MAGKDNLRPPQSLEEARERGRKGGIKSGEVRRNKKTVAETVSYMLKQPVTDPKQLAVIRQSGIPMPGKPTYQEFLVACVIMKTIKRGDVGDLLKISELIGESKAEKEVVEAVKIIVDV